MQYSEDREEILNIRLRLLGANNVIVAKCPGFATEIFMPTITGGRLSIINVVPQRRCSCISTNYIVSKETNSKSAGHNKTLSQTISDWCMSSDFSFDSQKASTPDLMRNNATNLKRHASLRQRSAVSKFLQFDNVINSHEAASQNQSRDVETNDHDIQPIDRIQTSASAEISSRIPLGSLSNMEWPVTPECSFSANECAGQKYNPLSTENTRTLPQWQKVLTPIRTYSRIKYSPAKVFDKLRTNFSKPTNGIKPERNIIKLKYKSHVIIDEKIRISPKTFKHQLQSENNSELYRKIRQEHKNRRNELNKINAHELFTTPAFRSYVSPQLKTDFSERCSTKGSSTYPKYKKLAAIVAKKF